MSEGTTLNKKKLTEIAEMLKNSVESYARLGVLGGKNSRSGEGEETNASIGAKHEFGDPNENLPIRSFLRVPISDNFQKYIDASAFFKSKKAFQECIEKGTIEPIITKFGILGEQIALEAFDTGGFGKWKPSNMKFKKTKQTLVETGQLMKAIVSDVKT